MWAQSLRRKNGISVAQLNNFCILTSVNFDFMIGMEMGNAENTKGVTNQFQIVYFGTTVIDFAKISETLLLLWINVQNFWGRQ